MIRTEQAKKLAEAHRAVVLAESLRLMKDPVPGIADPARLNLKRIFDEAAAMEDPGKAAWHLDLFLDEMPRSVWQFVDRPEVLADVASWCRAALSTKDLPASRAKDLNSLLKDLAAIQSYNKERKERPPKPAITDRKFK